MLALTVPPTAQGVVVVTQSGSRTAGFLESMDDKEVVIRRVGSDGTIQTMRFDRDRVEVIETVKPDRLEKLDPARPKEYRDYAEELAAKDDPEARETGLRVFLITAHLDPEGLGRGCLLSAARVARAAAEEKKIRALAYLLDPAHDRATLANPAAAVQTADPAWATFVKALKLYRKGGYKDAARMAAPKEVARCFAEAPGFISHADFLSECNQKDPPKFPDPASPVVRKILRIELEAEETPPAPPAKGAVPPPANPWAGAAVARARKPVEELSFERLTEFDPADCTFRGGKWRKPLKP